jgi:hypothetical protein
VPSYLITIIRTIGPSQSGIRYTDLTDIEKIQAVVREKLRKAGDMDRLAYIHVVPSTKPAEKDL